MSLQPDIIGEQHLHQDAVPFIVGQPDPAKGYVHIFDDLTALTLLQQLDTADDFIRYLTCKEELILANRLAFAPDEQCLLAVYLANISPNGGHVFPHINNDSARLVVDPESWQTLQEQPNYRRKRIADEPSYMWDRFIEHFTNYLENGLLVGENANDVAQIERLLREMASENRVIRRHLGKALLEIRDKIATQGRNFGARTVAAKAEKPDKLYVFVVVRNDNDDYELYREYRQKILQMYLYITKSRFPSVTKLLGVAFEPAGSDGGTEDAILFEPGQWNDSDYLKAQECARRLSLAERPEAHHLQDWEFPSRITLSPDERRKLRNKKKRQRRGR